LVGRSHLFLLLIVCPIDEIQRFTDFFCQADVLSLLYHSNYDLRSLSIGFGFQKVSDSEFIFGNLALKLSNLRTLSLRRWGDCDFPFQSFTKLEEIYFTGSSIRSFFKDSSFANLKLLFICSGPIRTEDLSMLLVALPTDLRQFRLQCSVVGLSASSIDLLCRFKNLEVLECRLFQDNDYGVRICDISRLLVFRASFRVSLEFSK
jgi:hypothetical protein